MSARPLDSKFALIDIEKRRHAIARSCRAGKRYRVMLEAVIGEPGSIGNDDGTSIEFGATVKIATIEEVDQ